MSPPSAPAAAARHFAPFAGIANRFLRLSIASKVFVGYGALVVLVLLMALVSLASLERIGRLNRDILDADVPLTDAAERMIDIVLDQELYANRAGILHGEEMLSLFRERGAEFIRLLEQARRVPGSGWAPFDRIAALHEEYTLGLSTAIARLHGGDADDSAGADETVRRTQEELISAIKVVASRARRNQYAKTVLTARIGRGAFWAMAAFCVVGLLISVASTAVLRRKIVGPLATLKGATVRISDGKYDDIPQIRSRDELGDLSRAFTEMAQRIKRMEEMYLDANPLTRLPGSIAIESVLRKRLETGWPLAFCLIDMDNFKAYNDRYGYARGSELIKRAARIVEDAVAKCGAPEDFVGHIGGDDLIVITVPDRFRGICAEVIARFDVEVREFYSPEDLARGSIRAKSRQGQETEYPVTTISIAVVTNTERRLDSPVQVGEMAAELKDYAKSLKGSVYVVDRRKSEDLSAPPQGAAAHGAARPAHG